MNINKILRISIILYSILGMSIGFFYVIKEFGDIIVKHGGLAMLISTIVLIVIELKRKKQPNQIEVAMIVIVMIIQIPIIVCWNYFFSLENSFSMIVLHGLFLIFGGICLLLNWKAWHEYSTY